MYEYLYILKNCIIFNNLKNDDLKKILDYCNYLVVNYNKDEIIAFEDEECERIGLVLEGSIEIKKIFSSGKSITLAKQSEGNIFGEVIFFSNKNTYPATIFSLNKTKIMYLPKQSILNLFNKYPIILNNFMRLLSNRVLMLNSKVKELSFDTIREKLCYYILEEYRKQKTFKIKTLTRKKMSDFMGLQRPSLSREFIKMKNEGLIDYDKNTIKILDLESIEDIIVNVI